MIGEGKGKASPLTWPELEFLQSRGVDMRGTDVEPVLRDAYGSVSICSVAVRLWDKQCPRAERHGMGDGITAGMRPRTCEREQRLKSLPNQTPRERERESLEGYRPLDNS